MNIYHVNQAGILEVDVNCAGVPRITEGKVHDEIGWMIYPPRVSYFFKFVLHICVSEFHCIDVRYR